MADHDQMTAQDSMLRHRLKEIALAGASDEAGAVAAMLGAAGDILARKVGPEDAAAFICGSVIDALRLVSPPAGSA